MAYNVPLSSRQVKEAFAQYGLRPKKYMGQNFLVDVNALKKIAAAANLGPSDTVLEIGPGLGILTQILAKRAKQVIAVEKDQKMAEILRKSFACAPHVKIVAKDALVYKIPNIQYKVIANLPYYITSPLIRKFLEARRMPELMVLMVQKEVAQRICAKPPRMSLLAVSVQAYAKPEIVSYVKKTSFWPQPKVDSAIIKIVPCLKSARADFKHTALFRVVRAGFKHPRKQLAGNLSKNLGISREKVEQELGQCNILPSQRAETLSIEDWRKLAESLQ